MRGRIFFPSAVAEETKELTRRPRSWHSWGSLVPNEGLAQEGGGLTAVGRGTACLWRAEGVSMEETWATNFVFLISELGFTLQRRVLSICEFGFGALGLVLPAVDGLPLLVR